jgi:hypothetical protein
MKLRTIVLLAACTVSARAVPVTGTGNGNPDLATFSILPESRLTLSGHASIVTWRLTSRQLRGSITVGASPHLVASVLSRWPSEGWLGEFLDGPPFPAQASIAVPVASLHSQSTDMMRDVRRALRAETFPNIHYEFLEIEEIRIKPTDRQETEVEMLSKGVLSIGGRNRIVSLNVVARRTESGTIHLRGITEIRMSDFNVEPPTRLFGLIRASDDVEIEFELYVKASHLASSRADSD